MLHDASKYWNFIYIYLGKKFYKWNVLIRLFLMNKNFTKNVLYVKSNMILIYITLVKFIIDRQF